MRKKINNKVVSIVVALALVCGVVMSAFAANDYVNPTFTDVPKSHWAYTFVEKAVEKGWVSGMGDGTFAPDRNVTYSQFCVMLVKAFYNEDYESYDGPKGAWYVPFTTIASQKGLLDGMKWDESSFYDHGTRAVERYDGTDTAMLVTGARRRKPSPMFAPAADRTSNIQGPWGLPGAFPWTLG